LEGLVSISLTLKITSYRDSEKCAFDDPMLKEIGERYRKSTAQVMLR
jgi:hypothetical protein